MDDTPRIRVWIRAVWRLPDGREITRTVKRDVAGDPKDDEHRAILFHELLEELRAVGCDFPEGHGALIEILGTMTD